MERARKGRLENDQKAKHWQQGGGARGRRWGHGGRSSRGQAVGWPGRATLRQQVMDPLAPHTCCPAA